MKKILSLMIIAFILVLCPVMCNAASTLLSYDSVTMIGEQPEVNMDDVFKMVAEQAKRAIEENPDTVMVAPPASIKVVEPVPQHTEKPVTNTTKTNSFVDLFGGF